jgi:hypothetical protein
MHNQHLWGAPLDTPEDVVGWLGAMQAQEFPVAKWSVAQRARDADNAAIDEVFAFGRILRTHILRPTWHFVLPADIRWMLKISGPRVNALNSHYYRKLGLGEEQLAMTNTLIAKALGEGPHLTRREIAALLERANISAEGLRLGYILMRAELDGVICSGAPKGKQQSYASLDERAPEVDNRDRDEALAELTRRYFISRGPATLKDYLRWSSLTAADGRKGLNSVESELEHEVADGRTYWFAPSSPGPMEVGGRIDLVQGYDECIMSYSESRDLLRSTTTFDENSHEKTAFIHAILLDGRLRGHWKRFPKRHSVVIETFLYRPLNGVERKALVSAVERYGRFLGVPASLL